MMKQSTIPEIKNFAKDLDIEEYWNNNSDNIFVEDGTDIAASNTNYCINNIDKNLQNLLKLPPLNLTNHLETDQCALISPTLTCTFNEILPTSPNIYFTQNKYIDEIKVNTMHNIVDNQIISNKNETVSTCLKNKTINELSLQRYIYITQYIDSIHLLLYITCNCTIKITVYSTTRLRYSK